MNTDLLEALLWERVDGTISAEDLAELEAHLAQHPEPHQLERQISKMTEMLDDAESVRPPSELRKKIDSALSRAKPPGVATRSTSPRSPIVATHPWMSRWLPLAASLAVGVAIGYLLNTGPAGHINPKHASGAITSPAMVPGPAFQIDLGGGSGLVRVAREANTINIDLDLLAEVELEISLRNADGRRVVLDANSPGTRRLVVEGEAYPVSLVVRKDGQIVAEHLIDSISPGDQP